MRRLDYYRTILLKRQRMLRSSNRQPVRAIEVKRPEEVRTHLARGFLGVVISSERNDGSDEVGDDAVADADDQDSNN